MNLLCSIWFHRLKVIGSLRRRRITRSPPLPTSVSSAPWNWSSQSQTTSEGCKTRNSHRWICLGSNQWLFTVINNSKQFPKLMLSLIIQDSSNRKDSSKSEWTSRQRSHSEAFVIERILSVKPKRLRNYWNCKTMVVFNAFPCLFRFSSSSSAFGRVICWRWHDRRRVWRRSCSQQDRSITRSDCVESSMFIQAYTVWISE